MIPPLAVGKPRKTTPFSASKKSRRGKSLKNNAKGGGFFGWAGRRPARLSNFCAKMGSSAVVELRQEWTILKFVHSWRKDGDSNPGDPVKSLHAFQACQFNHSCILPYGVNYTTFYHLLWLHQAQVADYNNKR